MTAGNTTEPLVWYAAYGSNLSSERFMTYLQGGIPEGSTRPHRGAVDPSPPREDRPYRLPSHALYFAKNAETWGGGGVAFIAPVQDAEASVLLRLYLVTAGQLRDILAQENDVDPASIEHLVPDHRLAVADPLESILLPEGDYRLLIPIGRERSSHGGEDSYPVWTFTSPEDLRNEQRTPSRQYLATICRGLVESHWGIQDTRRLWTTTDGRPGLRHLTDYLGATLTMEEEPRQRASAALDWACRRFVDERLQTGNFEVGRTEDRRGAGRRSIAQIGVTEQRSVLGLRPRRFWSWMPRWVILESHHPRKPVRLRAMLHDPRSGSKTLRDGTVHLDQKLRQALGVRARDDPRQIPGDRVTVSKPSESDRGLKGGGSAIGWFFHRLLRRAGGVQYQLMRVTIARYEEMEIEVCRIPETSFDILGIEAGDFVVLESINRRLSLRALTANERMCNERKMLASRSSKVTNCEEELCLRRLSENRDEDIPLIFIDQDARDALDVSPCDAIYVCRSVPRLLSKQLRALGLTVILTAAFVIFQLDIGDPRDLLWKLLGFGGAVVIGLLLVLLQIRKQLD